mmetsp:Transcript_11241/g.26679  ORF Transcript_11241/g.26679 Transcript_11241/m.26679 type:complete len:559 (-) Transcript_11241:1148-2824(-)
MKMPTVVVPGIASVFFVVINDAGAFQPINILNNANRQQQQQGRSFLETFDKFLTTLQDPLPKLENHTYLSGNYAPVDTENKRVPVIDVVQGQIPTDLDGVFIRNGPNPVPGRTFRKNYHWFDGHAMLHNLEVENGGAFYTNQFVPSIRYQIEQDLDEEYFPTLGEYSGVIGLIKILFHPTMVRRRVPDLNTVLPPNTNVAMLGNKLYCLNEGNIPFEIAMKPDGTLLPCGYESFDGLLDYPVSAHPQMDGDDDKVLFHSYTVNTDLIARDGPMKVGIYDVHTKSLDFYFSPTNETYISFAHSMIYTKNFMIIWDCNVHFDPIGMFDGGSFFRPKPNINLRFGIIPRNSTTQDDVIWIDTGSSAAIVHPLNAWEDEEDGSIVMWTPICENLVIDLETDDVNLFNMVEYKLDPVARTSTMNVIDNTINVEFSVSPKIGTFSRYAYTAIQDPSTPGEGSFSGICTWDMQERSFIATYHDTNEVGGEPMVATTPDGKIYVATYTYNFVDETSYFVMFDGQTNDLVVKLKLPYRVPFGFHGQWLSKNELDRHFDHHGFTRTDR